ncbi:endonuclease/exonuclease/phosphatase family protein [Saprospiraceae bacterium]|nr:endonuclease/exonuclease/phosphatase family protein [Saprospiraceae bacterium]
MKEFQAQAVWIMLSFLCIGLLAYLFNAKRIIFSSFACCALLCVFLKSASNSALKNPELNNEIKVSVAHVNVTSAEESYKALTDDLLARDIDIISLQEVKPDWSRVLKSALVKTHPYSIENVRIDPFGMAIFSKFPILEVDTIFVENVPFLAAKVKLPEGKEVTIVNTMIQPNINTNLDQVQEKQLNFVRDYLVKNSGTELVVGDFNMVYWSNRIREFREGTKLMNSRRDVSQSVLSVPYDHIFHSEDLECISFRDMIDSSGHRIGICAKLQYFNNLQEL